MSFLTFFPHGDKIKIFVFFHNLEVMTLKQEKFETHFWSGINPILDFGGRYPGYRPRTEVDREYGIVCEYDVAIKAADGTRFFVNVFRPEQEGQYPILIAWGPYGKHVPFNEASYPGSGVSSSDLSRHCVFEGPDPAYWCRHGYVIISADPRGAWGSEGDHTFMSREEAEDCIKLMEWACSQPWSDGKIGMTGVSYLAAIQWRVAALNPPYLAAINPWEGESDLYRDVAFHGGIPNIFFDRMARGTWAFSSSRRVEDLVRMREEHPFFDEYWASKTPELEKITVPMFVVANWSDHGLHTRGTLEGFKRASSKEKYLLIHGRKKWQFYRQMVDLQRKFFDRYLKGIENEVRYWPRVIVEVRERYMWGNFRAESEWPIARTEYRKLFLNGSGRLQETLPSERHSIIYDSQIGRAQFEYVFTERTELTGYMKVKLWVEAEDSNDMDLFIAIEKYDRDGEFVRFPHNVLPHENAPVALGWMRVSHRELDQEKSTFYQPFYKHERQLRLKPREVVPVEIEIWPTSVLFHAGEKLRIVVQGRDILSYRGFGHYSTVNKGNHILHMGGEYDSYLLVPVIPQA